jgi:rhodanese-related sulfurtransferase
LTPDTVYWYRVAASNTAGLSPCAVVSVRTLSDFEFWRRAHFTAEQLADPLISGEDADPDCDGFTNFQEFLAGTGPTDAGSCLKCFGAPVVTSGGISLQWQSAGGKVYSVAVSTNLMSDLFTNRLATGILATPPTNTYEDAVSRGGCVFYRVVCDEKPDPFFPSISATQALQVIAARGGDPDFVVLDVRTCVEYETRHIVGAINIDYDALGFETQLDALDKNKTYLIHCWAGGRSGPTHDLMSTLGFLEVYDMLGGIEAFAALPGAAPYLTP